MGRTDARRGARGWRGVRSSFEVADGMLNAETKARHLTGNLDDATQLVLKENMA
jgi:hypothetical protein